MVLEAIINQPEDSFFRKKIFIDIAPKHLKLKCLRPKCLKMRSNICFF
jgi:hypothetical protein